MSVNLSDQAQLEIEAATFRRLLAHLDSHKEVQNLDLMNLAHFCRNCLAKWYQAGAEAQGKKVSYDDARKAVYGMPYNEWKDKHVTEATDAQKRAFQETKPLHSKISGH